MSEGEMPALLGELTKSQESQPLKPDLQSEFREGGRAAVEDQDGVEAREREES